MELEAGEPRIVVFAASTQLSVTFEMSAGRDELHVHPAGQGFWVARMLTVLGAQPVLCTPIGGETGTALRALLGDLPSEGLLASAATNGSYVHDRRSGQRRVVAQFASGPLDRHMEDDLVSLTMANGLGTPVAVVCGSNLDGNIDAGVFERICANLRATGTRVVADLSGLELRSALAGGVDVLKISLDEMVDAGWAFGDEPSDAIEGIERLRKAGAVDVLVSCGDRGSIVAIGDEMLRVEGPSMTVVDDRGAGDSMTAALAFGLATNMDTRSMVRLAAASAALNVTRHGLASGHRDAIRRLEPHVRIVDVDVDVGV
jgi:1-phosphofructokinase